MITVDSSPEGFVNGLLSGMDTHIVLCAVTIALGMDFVVQSKNEIPIVCNFEAFSNHKQIKSVLFCICCSAHQSFSFKVFITPTKRTVTWFFTHYNIPQLKELYAQPTSPQHFGCLHTVMLHVLPGLAQRRILGLLLFNSYMLQLNSVNRRLSISFLSYADDIQLYMAVGWRHRPVDLLDDPILDIQGFNVTEAQPG